jgi:hypothetical protein
MVRSPGRLHRTWRICPQVAPQARTRDEARPAMSRTGLGQWACRRAATRSQRPPGRSAGRRLGRHPPVTQLRHLAQHRAPDQPQPARRMRCTVPDWFAELRADTAPDLDRAEEAAVDEYLKRRLLAERLTAEGKLHAQHTHQSPTTARAAVTTSGS